MSHDRAFLDNVVTQTIAYEGEGRWKEYAGGYDDWQRARRAAPAAPAPDAGEPRAQRAGSRGTRRKTKLSFNEARELETIPGRIEALEREQAGLAAQLADPAIYQDRGADLKSLNSRHAQIEEELVLLLARWEELEAVKAALP